MPARDSLSLEDGMRTVSCIATLALRIRVSMSAMGSVIVMRASPLSPTGLRHAGHLSRVCQLAQADTAETELAEHGPRPTAPLAAGIRTNLELRLALLLLDKRLFGHESVTAPRVGTGSRRHRAALDPRHW